MQVSLFFENSQAFSHLDLKTKRKRLVYIIVAFSFM